MPKGRKMAHSPFNWFDRHTISRENVIIYFPISSNALCFIAQCDTLLDQKTALCLIRDGAEVLAIIAQLSIFALSLIDSIWQTVTQNHVSYFPKLAYGP